MESENEYGYEIVENGVLKTSYEMEIEKNTQTNKVELGLSLNEKEYEVTQVIENDETRFYVELENEQTDQEIEYVFVKVISGDTVTYHFRIPFTYIQTNSTVNAAALYSRNSSSSTDDACAYFLFVKDAQGSKV